MCTVRPNVQCTFDIMSECAAYFEDERLERACIAGARDAHLQPVAPRSWWSDEEDGAYVLGWNSTVVGCPHACT